MQKIAFLFIVFIIISCKTKPSEITNGEIIDEKNEYTISLIRDFSDESIADSIPTEAFNLKESGRILSEQGDYQKAIEYYTKAIEIAPNYVVAYNSRGISRKNLGDLQGAIEDYNTVIAINPQYSKAYYNRAILKKEQGDLAGAIKDYTRAIEINPYDIDFYINRSISKNILGDVRGAVKDCDIVIELASLNGLAYYNRAIYKEELGDKKSALNDYSKAIEIDPEHGDAYINRGVLKYEMGDYEGEIEDYQLCLTMAKETDNNVLIEEVSHNLGRALYDLKRFEEAAEAYSEGILVAPENGQLYYGRGLSRNQSGDKEGACEDWRKSSSLGCFEANVLLPLCDGCEILIK